jgi:hypothetical protein
VALVRERTIPTERPPLVGEVNYLLRIEGTSISLNYILLRKIRRNWQRISSGTLLCCLIISAAIGNCRKPWNITICVWNSKHSVAMLPFTYEFTQSASIKVSQSVSQSVCLDVDPHLFPMTRCLILSTITVVSLWGALSDERSGLSIVSHSFHF